MTAPLAEPEEELIGRCYTKARRAPLVHGVIRDVHGGRGIRIPGGPYTLTQLAAIVTSFIALILTRTLWGGHGLLDVAVLLGLPFGAAFALRRLHIDGRNPVAALISVTTLLTGPKQGRIHGRPFRPTRPARGDTRITLAATRAETAELPRPAAAAPLTTRHSPAPAPTAPAATVPEPAAAAPVQSGVQALLARRTTPPHQNQTTKEVP
ncbi:hypothetical protein ABT282_33990 [Streptomyces sp. NPDC000927]|uniref:hypothetical protein n=1 Tax=Streptomyces sp. NPDC000927 TaxID=3154371 RepID=UPI003327E723